MKKRVKKKRIISGLKGFLKRLLTKHLNCTVWAAVGIYVLVSGKTGRVQYFITWSLLIAVMWRYMPDKKVTDITDAAKKYPVGSKVRLSCDFPDYEPRTVQGYKQIGETRYLIFSDGHTACIERIATGGKKVYEIFGEMDSAEEINRTAEGLKNEGDKENLFKLAEENGIDAAFARMYYAGETESLCDAATAAIGKIEAEAAELKPVEIIADWTEYIKVSCLDNEELARAVRRKGKSLKGCITDLLCWSFEASYKVDKDIVEAARKRKPGMPIRVEMGIPGMGRAKKLIKEYYLREGTK